MQSNLEPKFTNRPKHLILNNSYYFFTVRTIEGQWFLQPEQYKQILLDIIHQKSQLFNYSLIAYAILHNHYHLILEIPDASNIPKFFNQVNGASSRAINIADGNIHRKIWWNYFDHIIRDESDFYKHLNYIHQNPIKHTVSKGFDYQFSSYNAWLKKKGAEYLNESFEKFPIKDFITSGDEY